MELPELPDEIKADALDAAVRRELRGLDPDTADRVARHLVMAAVLLEEDADGALSHAQAARSLAPRIAASREAVGLAAYAAGQWALARSELRAARRMTGAPDFLPLLADCERGLGSPESALRVAEDASAARLDASGRVELAIVVSGARRDLGDARGALSALQAALRSVQRPGAAPPWAPRVLYAAAEAHLALDDVAAAARLFRAAAVADTEGDTDAADRSAALPPGVL